MDLAIEIKNLNHSFGKKIICNNMNINFEYGKIYGLLGKNGTGKSTLINLIGNQLVCKSGEIKIFGKTIKEDILGFNHISIQAKRYALDNNVQRHEVQSFVGAVAGTPSKKGVFITTSDYTKGAMEYVESLNGSPTIILINGQQLTEYIYDYGLGLQTEKVLKVMKMDMDYWDAMDNA